MLAEFKLALKELLQTALGPAYDAVMPVLSIFTPFLYPGFLYWLFILSAVLVAFGVYVYSAGTRSVSLRGFLSYLAPKSIYGHPSAWLDCKFYVVSSLTHLYLKFTGLAVALVALLPIGEAVGDALALAFGPVSEQAEPSWLARAGYTLILVAAVDFAKWLTHYLQHKIPLLWEFHQVHHSAPVLTPLTNLRVHPVDILLETVLAGIAAALVVGAYGYFYSGGIAEITILGMSAVFFASSLLAPLRHSHIPLSFGPVLSKVLCSPVMHQFHHSAEVKHFDKNFSLVFSLWDYLAGTIYIPAPKETPAQLGIGPDGEAFRSVWALYAHPFISLARKLRGRMSRVARA